MTRNVSRETIKRIVLVLCIVCAVTVFSVSAFAYVEPYPADKFDLEIWEPGYSGLMPMQDRYFLDYWSNSTYLTVWVADDDSGYIWNVGTFQPGEFLFDGVQVIQGYFDFQSYLVEFDPDLGYAEFNIYVSDNSLDPITFDVMYIQPSYAINTSPVTYQDGYAKGYNDAMIQRSESMIDYSLGYDKGVSDATASFARDVDTAYTSGYSAGYSAGSSVSTPSSWDGFFEGIIFAPVRGFTNMLNFEFFGVNVSNLLISAFSICLVLFVLTKVVK